MIALTGIKNYSTFSPGIGGRIKKRIDDFKVEEISPDGKVCEIRAFAGIEKKELEKQWPENSEEREHLVLELEKFNLDLNDAIRRITRFLGVSRKRIGFAGMKDKRGITCQRISVWTPDYGKLKEFNSRYIDLRFGSWADERIDLGMLKGNKFEVTVREIGLSEKDVRERIEQCFKEMKGGIANYFGEQRFGGIRQITHLVGKQLVERDFEGAIMLYLTATSPGEEESIKNARIQLAETKNFSEATKAFPVKYRYERSMIHHLCKYPKDFVGAFKKLPKQLRYMFTHAYQSYLFNKIINKRIEAGIGLKEIEGDILEGGIPTAALFGFESELASGKPGEIEREALAEEGIELKEFQVKEFSEVSSKGTRKQIALFPEKLELKAVEEDEFTEGKLKAMVSFYLGKGNYATTVLREIMKN